MSEQPSLTLGFVRGIAPEKWARRWSSVRSRRAIELVPIDATGDVDPAPTDMALVRTAPNRAPARSEAHARSRHAVKLYDEAVVLVVPAQHEAAELRTLSVDELELITLLDYEGHDATWPRPEPWKDAAWRPASVSAALELVATGLGAILMSGPLARHLTNKHDHRVVEVTGELPAPSVWATWEVTDDSNEMQELIGVLRGRTSRSSR